MGIGGLSLPVWKVRNILARISTIKKNWLDKIESMGQQPRKWLTDTRRGDLKSQPFPHHNNNPQHGLLTRVIV